MGQYYMPTLIEPEDGSIKTLYSHDYDNGLKLMEHSYIGNNFMDAVSSLIWKHPMKVAWIGDYSNSPYDPEEPYSSKMPVEEFMQYYHAVWSEEGEKKHNVKPESVKILTMRHKNRFIINHTRKIYIRIGDYIKRSKWTESSYWKNGIRLDHPHYFSMCVHPLSLLTACGNDRGGGDYRYNCPGYEHVGTWAFDIIEISDKAPKDYTAVDYEFRD